MSKYNLSASYEVNLTHWKQGGFLDWQNLNQKRDWLAQLAEDAADLHPAAGGALAEKLALVLAADLAFTARNLLESATGPQDRRHLLRELLPELARLRHDGHRSQLLELSRRRSDRLEAESRERARVSTRAQEQLISHLYASSDPSLKALAVELAQNLLSAQDPAPPSPGGEGRGEGEPENLLAARHNAAPPLDSRPSTLAPRHSPLDSRPTPNHQARLSLIKPNKAIPSEK